MTASAPFRKALQATGYLDARGRPSPGLAAAGTGAPARLRGVLLDRRVGLRADAVFAVQGAPTSVFKDAAAQAPSPEELAGWHEAAWNAGVAPLLWIVTPTDVRLYNCYAPSAPPPDGGVAGAELGRYPLDSPDALRELDAACGRLATETGAFWSSPIGARIDRRHRVDRELLAEISALEQQMVALGPRGDETGEARARDVAQRVIGRCIFTWYLIDRGLAQPFLPPDLPPDLAAMFATPERAFRLFDWLRSTFNGDLFPMDDPGAERDHLTSAHLALIRDFVAGTSLVAGRRGQGRLFRFRFSAIPVDLISAIYQQFARSSAAGRAREQGLHYTPVELVHLTLDPVFEGLPETARVIDPTCGSGAFLVEAFRRLVWRASRAGPPSRAAIREILRTRLFGVDVNRAALGIAAFSLYLAALELDEEPVAAIEDLRFDRLIGETLFEADSLGPLPPALTARPFDAVVGNPPWTFVRRGDGAARRVGVRAAPRPRRSPDQAFLSVAADLAGPAGRVGMVLKATPFFSKDNRAVAARAALLERLAPAALVNLSLLRREGLFPDAVSPALVLFSRCALGPRGQDLLLGSLPWTPDFRRTGVFHVGPGELRPTSLARVLAAPPLLKAATFGTARDAWLLARLERECPRLDAVLDSLGVSGDRHRGQGFKVEGPGKAPPAAYASLSVVTPDKFTPFRIAPSTLERFKHPTLHRQRRESIFRAPLLLCPKVGYARATEQGRYAAAVHLDDVLFTESFFGLSFQATDPTWAYALSAVLNSSITSFQLAFGGPTWGIERPTVQPHDLLSLRVPSLSDVSPEGLRALLAAEAHAACRPHDPEALAALDDTVLDLYDLDPEERVVAGDAVARAAHLIFEGGEDRARAVVPPSEDALLAYAAQVTATVNAYLRARGERHLRALLYGHRRLDGADWGAGVPGMSAVRFTMAPGAPPRGDAAAPGQGDANDLADLAGRLRGGPAGAAPPYLNERRQLRVYGEGGLFVLKPSEARCWTRTAALNDADLILGDHWMQARDAAARA